MQDQVLNHWITRIRTLFGPEPPSGWLLGWNDERYFDDFAALLKSYGELVNETSFDYSFCNSYVLYVGDRSNESFESLTISLSFVADAFQLIWSGYRSFGRKGSVFNSQSDFHIEIENRCRGFAQKLGFIECSPEVFNMPIKGVRLELSGKENVTVGKCLFDDFDDS